MGEPVAAPQRLELVAAQPPGADDGVAGVVGDHDPPLRIPGRRVGLGPVRQPADLDRAHAAVVAAAPTTAAPGSAASPLPSIVRSVWLRPLSIQKTCSSVITGSQP